MDVYRNDNWVVRALMWGSVVFAAVMLWFAVMLAGGYGIDYEAGGVLHPLKVRLAMASLPAVMGLAFWIAMWAYGRHYVSELRWSEERRTLEVGTMGWFGTRRRTVPLADVAGSEPREDRFSHNGFARSIPWDALRLRGKRLPLIVDAVGEVPDRDAFEALLHGRSPAEAAARENPPLSRSAAKRLAHQRRREWRRKPG